MFSKGGCCTLIELDLIGMADFYQGQLLGKYSKVSKSKERSVYHQSNGEYLYWLSSGIWMVPQSLDTNDDKIKFHLIINLFVMENIIFVNF